MRFLFDNNLSPHLAHAIRELCQREQEVEAVQHLRDRGRGDSNDLDWIPSLSSEGAWCIVSVDRFKKQGGAEREALRRAGHTVFMLDRQWLRHTYWPQAERMVLWWPQILHQAAIISGGAFAVPWRHGQKLKAIRL